MTEFRNQSNQRSAKEMKSCTSRGKMLLFLTKLFFIFSTCDVSRGYRIYEDRAEFVTEREVLNASENESITGLESAWEAALTDRPGVIVIELRQPLLEKIKTLLMKENETYSGNEKISLATFDSTGFQDVTAFDDYVKLRQAVLGLRATPNEKNSTPSMHALVELLRQNVSSPLLLLTMTKPDEDFIDDLIREMTDKNTKVSVLWVGDGNTNEYLPLKAVAEKTRGRFIKLRDNEENMSRSNFDYQKLRFPERSSENDQDDGMPLTSRAADQRVIQKAVVPLIVEVASGSSLEIRPGTASQIQFTIKNNINVAVPAFFTAKFNGVAQNVQPPQALLPPAGSVTVIVNLQPLGPTQNLNAVGTLTLFTHAANRVTARSALISMTPQTTTDYTAPKMHHKYDGDCTNYKEPQNCEHGQWSLEVTLQDEDSGLLKILSEPYGLLFHSEFIAGSKTPITAQYTATCCQPVVHIWGEDLRGNYVKKSFDVFNQNLLAGEIASIVLGILLLLLILVVIIVAIVLVRRRNRRNLIIPRPRSGSR